MSPYRMRINTVLLTMILFLAGCGGNQATQTTDHFKITFLNSDQVWTVNQPARFQFSVKSIQGQLVPKQVVLDFISNEMDHGTNQVQATLTEQGLYEAETVLPMGGKWRVDVGVDKEKVDFPFQAKGAMK